MLAWNPAHVRNLISDHDEILKCAIKQTSMFWGGFPGIRCPLMDSTRVCSIECCIWSQVKVHEPRNHIRVSCTHKISPSLKKWHLCFCSVQWRLRGVFMPRWMFFSLIGMERDNNMWVCNCDKYLECSAVNREVKVRYRVQQECARELLVSL